MEICCDKGLHGRCISLVASAVTNACTLVASAWLLVLWRTQHAISGTHCALWADTRHRRPWLDADSGQRVVLNLELLFV